jgi:hypothetical protein
VKLEAGDQRLPISLDMVVAFGTALSGTGKFKTRLLFSFASPFDRRMRFFDPSSRLKSRSILKVDHSCHLMRV